MNQKFKNAEKITLLYPFSKKLAEVDVLTYYYARGFEFALHENPHEGIESRAVQSHKYCISEFSAGGRAGTGQTIEEVETEFFKRAVKYDRFQWTKMVGEALKQREELEKELAQGVENETP